MLAHATQRKEENGEIAGTQQSPLDIPRINQQAGNAAAAAAHGPPKRWVFLPKYAVFTARSRQEAQ